MNRRGFLGLFAGGLVLDPERLLWTPGKKLISIPEPRPIQPNLTIRLIRNYNLVRHQFESRLDLLYGMTVYGEEGPTAYEDVIVDSMRRRVPHAAGAIDLHVATIPPWLDKRHSIYTTEILP